MKKHIRTVFLSFAILFLAFPSGTVLAHGAATSLNKIVGNYMVEFEYGEAGNPRAGTFIAYDFDVVDPITLDFFDFKYAFVRFAGKDNKTTYVNGNIAPDSINRNRARIGVGLPEAGQYVVSVRFYDDRDEVITEASFDLTVDSPYESRDFSSVVQQYMWIVTLGVGLALGLGIRKVVGKLPKRDS
ncbi:MAG: hypothetical protein ACYCZ0_00605 [Minisyncoccota bacterium]